MSFKVNIQHLQIDGKHYEGEIPVEDLDLNLQDELIHAESGLCYDLWVEKHEENLLLQGELKQMFRCECARCLQPFDFPVRIEDWSGFVALEGEESLEVNNDMVDLTAVLREDILLVLPQHPVCGQDCQGITPAAGTEDGSDDEGQGNNPTPWDALDHLKLEKDKS